jgi:multiple sugar transport system permease protein
VNPAVTRATRSVIAVIILIVMLFPLYWMLNLSLQPRGTGLATDWIPRALNFEGYAAALRDQGNSLLVSLIVSLVSVVVTLLIATPAAYALAQFRLRGVNVVLLVLAVSQMIPGIVIANSLYGAYNSLGLLNSFGGLILADASHSIPFAILIMRVTMQGIPVAVLEAAKIDGANQVRTFFSVAIPLARNGVITAALFSFLFSWSDFLFALTLTTTEQLRPVTLGIYEYLGADQTDWNAVMATAVFAALPATVLLLVAQRYVAAGAMSGSVK